MPPKSTSRSHSNGRRPVPSTKYIGPSEEFTELNEDLDQPFAIADPPYVHNWINYPRFVEFLIYREQVPPSPPAETGSSSGSTSILLPPLNHPVERVIATIVASFDSLRMFMNKKFEEIQNRFRNTVTTHNELLSLKKECEANYKCHENLANGVIELTEKVTALTLEVATAKAERDEAKKDRAAISAQLELAVQSIEALNAAMEQTQQHVEEMAEEIEALGGGQEEEEEDGLVLADLAGDPEEMEVEGQEEVIDP